MCFLTNSFHIFEHISLKIVILKIKMSYGARGGGGWTRVIPEAYNSSKIHCAIQCLYSKIIVLNYPILFNCVFVFLCYDVALGTKLIWYFRVESEGRVQSTMHDFETIYIFIIGRDSNPRSSER